MLLWYHTDIKYNDITTNLKIIGDGEDDKCTVLLNEKHLSLGIENAVHKSIVPCENVFPQL